MKDPRAWIVVLCAVTFMAGAAAGVLFSRATAPATDQGPFSDYAERLIDEFDLTSERAGHLRVILREYQAEIERIEESVERKYAAAMNADLAAQLVPTGIEYNRHIRDKLLPPEQREKFDALASASLYPTR